MTGNAEGMKMTAFRVGENTLYFSHTSSVWWEIQALAVTLIEELRFPTQKEMRWFGDDLRQVILRDRSGKEIRSVQLSEDYSYAHPKGRLKFIPLIENAATEDRIRDIAQRCARSGEPPTQEQARWLKGYAERIELVDEKFATVWRSCLDCRNYHGMSYGYERGAGQGSFLVCGFHPSGWNGVGVCPDLEV